MSKTNKNILGDQRGKIGKVVGRVVEGVQMYSATPGSRGGACTQKQREHRARFSAIAKMGKPLKGIIKIGMRETASTKRLQSPFNIYLHQNLQHTLYNEETGIATPVFSDIVLAEGIVPYVTFGSPTFEEGQQVTIPFTGNIDWPGAFDEDSVYAVAYCPDLILSATSIALRSADSLSFTLPSNWAGKTIHLWGFTQSSVTTKIEIEKYGMTLTPGCCSSSIYIGSGVVA